MPQGIFFNKFLDLDGATIDEELDSIDEAGVIGGEEEGDRRDLLRPSQLAAWDLGLEELYGDGSVA